MPPVRTVLVNPPWWCLQNMQSPFVPIGLAYVAGALTEAGHCVRIINGEEVVAPHTLDPDQKVPPAFFHATDRYERLNEPTQPFWTALRDAILAESPDVVGLTMWSGAYSSALNVCRSLKAARPDILTVVGGVHATIDPKSVLDHPEVDFVVCGEGEGTAVALWDIIRSGGRDVRHRAAGIPGVWTVLDGAIHEGGRAELVKDVDTIPAPNYEVASGDLSRAVRGIITARGCPFRCGFCASSALWTSKVRFRSIEACMDELASHRQRFGLRHFRINDDSFCLKKRRVLEFCDQLTERFGRGAWTFWVDANAATLDEEIIDRLETSGCTTIAIGVESVAPRIVDQFIRKPIDLDHVRRLIDRMSRGPIASGAYFMTGFPSETEEELSQTIEFMREVSPTYSMWGVVTPYPGTELHRYAIEHGILPDANPMHLTHHSIRTSMASIAPDRYQELLHRILDIKSSIEQQHRQQADRRHLLRRIARKLSEPARFLMRTVVDRRPFNPVPQA